MRTHGQNGTKLNWVWQSMRQRCHNPRHPYYHRYGGRGISVCAEWKDFSQFSEWAKANGYVLGLTLERKDNNGNYSPDNCCWATRKAQARNTASTLRLSDGRAGCEVAELNGVNRAAFVARVGKLGWSVEDACTQPVRHQASRSKGKVNG